MESHEREIKNIDAYIKLEKTHFIEKYENTNKSNTDNIISLTDFSFLKTLWTGSFGNIILARHNLSKEIKTIKIVNKRTVSNRQNYVETEKNIMAAICSFPFTVKLEGLVKYDQCLYMIMPILSVSNLLEVLTDLGTLNETTARFFSAQVRHHVIRIVLAVEFLHASGLVYRNLKPENVLININGYLKLSNFSISKRIGHGRTYTLCGTPDYMAPELIAFTGYGQAVDLWSLGVILYELVAGQSPFSGPSLNVMFESIAYCKYKMSESFSPPLQDLINSLIQVDLSKRLGNLKNGMKDIKNHPWFKVTNWLQIINQKIEAPYKPNVTFKSKRKLYWTKENTIFDF